MPASFSEINTDVHSNRRLRLRAQQEHAVVQSFVEELYTRWQMTYHHHSHRRPSGATGTAANTKTPLALNTANLSNFPLTPSERQIVYQASRIGLWQGTLAGVGTLAALRGGPWALLRIAGYLRGRIGVATRRRGSRTTEAASTNKKTDAPSGSSQNTSHGFQSPFASRGQAGKPSRLVDAGFLLVDVALSGAVGFTVMNWYVPSVGDPTTEALVSLPGVSSPEPSVVVQQVCPLAVDMFHEFLASSGNHPSIMPLVEKQSIDTNNEGVDHNLSQQSTPLLAQKAQTYRLDALQRFIKNCQRRQRVEQTMAWQERNMRDVSIE